MTAALIDLSWVTFTDDEPARRCEYMDNCPAQAAYMATYQPVMPCTHSRKLYCPAHRETIILDAHLKDGQFRCWACGDGSVAFLVRIDPL